MIADALETCTAHHVLHRKRSSVVVSDPIVVIVVVVFELDRWLPNSDPFIRVAASNLPAKKNEKKHAVLGLLPSTINILLVVVKAMKQYQCHMNENDPFAFHSR